ncbi:DUF3800 domain-containing protein [Streptomyces sp. RGM 3693]|uniref:DUF3800 domain-containing protein n=1 Tax=Streptomyces sp. RGM 3693 TaxID=3413284 RepID=UPI003D295E2E
MATSDSAAPVRLVYVDDGGDARTLTAFAALSLRLDELEAAKRALMSFRATLETDLGIPVDASLHAQDLVAGRGRHVYRPDLPGPAARAAHLTNCRAVIHRQLQVIAELPGAQVTAVHRATDDYGRDRPALYRAWLARTNARLAASGEHAVVVLDGDGSERALIRAHRELPDADRRIQGDPVFLSARLNYFLQAADVLAFAAYQSVAKRPERAFMHDWFGTALPTADGPGAL